MSFLKNLYSKIEIDYLKKDKIMAIKKLYLEQKKEEIFRPLSLEPKPDKDNIMSAFSSGMQSSLKRASQQSGPKVIDNNNTFLDRSATSTQQ